MWNQIITSQEPAAAHIRDFFMLCLLSLQQASPSPEVRQRCLLLRQSLQEAQQPPQPQTQEPPQPPAVPVKVKVVDSAPHTRARRPQTCG